MSQKVNALPDVNREDNTPDIQIAVHDIGGDVRYSDRDRNTALPDENQSRVLPRVQIATGGPLVPNGRTVIVDKNGVTGNIQQKSTPFSVGPQQDDVAHQTKFEDDSSDYEKINTI